MYHSQEGWQVTKKVTIYVWHTSSFRHCPLLLYSDINQRTKEQNGSKVDTFTYVILNTHIRKANYYFYAQGRYF